jgi:2-iminobutanoate/2-iminopropanoate deaminase
MLILMKMKSIDLGEEVLGAYSIAIQANNTVYVSGQLAIDDDGNTVGIDDINAQTNQSLKNLGKVLNAAGLDYSNVADVRIYLKDIKKDFTEMNEVYSTFFKKPYPARATVEAKLVSDDFLIEITAVAVK